MSGAVKGTSLVAAFGPFDGPVNASAVLVGALRRRLREALAPHGRRRAFRVFDRDTESLPEQLDAAISRHRPPACLFIGQARQRNRLAVDVRDFAVPDARGVRPCNRPVCGDGPAAYRSTPPFVESIVAAWRVAEIPGGLSSNAGTHLCNQVRYLGLQRAVSRGEDLRAGFLNVPVSPARVAGGIGEVPGCPWRWHATRWRSPSPGSWIHCLVTPGPRPRGGASQMQFHEVKKHNRTCLWLGTQDWLAGACSHLRTHRDGDHLAAGS